MEQGAQGPKSGAALGLGWLVGAGQGGWASCGNVEGGEQALPCGQRGHSKGPG